MPFDNLEPCWFAARIISNRQYVLDSVAKDGVQTYITPVVPNILFIKAAFPYVRGLSIRCAGMLFFYRDADRKNPGIIDEKQMSNFILVTSAPEDSLIFLGEVTHNFLEGQKVRVTGGIFEGAEGVIKRIKGDRRLIVNISGVVCVATAFIHPSLLEPLTDD